METASSNGTKGGLWSPIEMGQKEGQKDHLGLVVPIWPSSYQQLTTYCHICRIFTKKNL